MQTLPKHFPIQSEADSPLSGATEMSRLADSLLQTSPPKPMRSKQEYLREQIRLGKMKEKATQ